jgi:hypothetical protein
VVLKAVFASPMGRKDYTLFRELAERDSPKRPVSALVAIIGKDSIASALATDIAALGDFSRLRLGEKGDSRAHRGRPQSDRFQQPRPHHHRHVKL